jgi:hypothetical protein
MLREQVFSDRSNYPKVSDTATPIDAVEWFAKNKGITNLDDPSAKVRTIIDDVNQSELARHEAKKARESKAQDEFLDAMFNLDSGTAVLRQKRERTKPASKPKKMKVAKKIAKVAKPVVKEIAPRTEAKRESEISDLGDMLDALDYLRVRKEVAARMPTSTPDEIMAAAYREFKRVAKDVGSTISEVLAVKDGQ